MLYVYSVYLTFAMSYSAQLSRDIISTSLMAALKGPLTDNSLITEIYCWLAAILHIYLLHTSLAQCDLSVRRENDGHTSCCDVFHIFAKCWPILKILLGM